MKHALIVTGSVVISTFAVNMAFDKIESLKAMTALQSTFAKSAIVGAVTALTLYIAAKYV